jgi:hypothetical protein
VKYDAARRQTVLDELDRTRFMLEEALQHFSILEKDIRNWFLTDPPESSTIQT